MKITGVITRGAKSGSARSYPGPYTMMCTCRLIKALLGSIGLILISTLPVMAASVEYFDHATFTGSAGSLTTINFDALAPCNGCVAGNEYVAQGLTITQRDGAGINVVQNLVPGGYGVNYVTQANINSSPNVISSSILTNSATNTISDNYDFIFTSPVTAAGLFIGNLGGGSGSHPAVLNPTTVQFLDVSNGIIASEDLTKAHSGVIFGATGETWDNRIFYGITSDAAIKTVRIFNGTNDGDGITFDDIQFGATPVPEPATLLLLGSGLAGMGWFGRKRLKNDDDKA